ncbi:MAG TPA: hypothetical protein VMX11_00815 [Actinomycetes bacterium]|nr:hypothetical protein [Actinomycetes bacterium]
MTATLLGGAGDDSDGGENRPADRAEVGLGGSAVGLGHEQHVHGRRGHGRMM